MSQVADAKGVADAIGGNVKLPGKKKATRKRLKKSLQKVAPLLEAERQAQQGRAFSDKLDAVAQPAVTQPPSVTKLSREEAIAQGLIDPDTTSYIDPKIPRLSRAEAIQQGYIDPPGSFARAGEALTGTSVENDPQGTERLVGTTTGSVTGFFGGAATGVAIANRIPIPPLPQPLLGPVGLIFNRATLSFALGTYFGAKGAYFGTKAPETAQEIGEYFGVFPQGYREKNGLSPSELEYVARNEELLDLYTSFGFSLFRGTFRAGSDLVTGAGNPVARELAEIAAKEGIHMMPVQLGNKTIARMYVNVFGRFPFLGSIIRKRGELAEEGLQKLLDKLPARLGQVMGAGDVNKKIMKNALTMMKLWNRHFKRGYKAVFTDAKKMGVVAKPINAVKAGEDQLRRIAERTPSQGSGAPTPGPVLEKVKSFIEENILTLRGAADPETARRVLQETGHDLTKPIDQTLLQMDGLLGKLDQFFTTLDPVEHRFASEIMGSVKDAILKDVTENVRGEGAKEISARWRALDKEYSSVLQEVFETTTAQRFHSVRKQGIRKIGVDKDTRRQVETMGKTIIDLESADAIKELSKLASKQTMGAVGAVSMETAIENTFKFNREAGGVVVNSQAWRKFYGLGNPKSPRYKAAQALLEASGSPVTMKNLEDWGKIFEKFEGFVIPNASTFLSRRAGIGGVMGVIHGLLPGAAVVAGSSSVFGGLMSMALLFGGGKMFSAMISNPASARALKAVARDEIITVGSNKLIVNALRIGITSITQDGDILPEVGEKLSDIVPPMVDVFAYELEDRKAAQNGKAPRNAPPDVEESLDEDVEESLDEIEKTLEEINQ